MRRRRSMLREMLRAQDDLRGRSRCGADPLEVVRSTLMLLMLHPHVP